MTFELGQILKDKYPPEAAVWCNESGSYYIDEIDPVEGIRRFQIVKTPEPTNDELAEQVRGIRNNQISKTDYLLTPDYPISEENLTEIKTYRQALRDIPEQSRFPKDVIWPEVPKFLCKDSGSLGLAKIGL